MRGDIVYRIYGQREGRAEDTYLGVYRSSSEAEAEIARLNVREIHGKNWAAKYHNLGFEIRETVVDVDFVIPAEPGPRERYFVEGTSKPNAPGTWHSTIVRVFRRGDTAEPALICQYERNYSLLQTFEPFRQGDRDFALISRDYTRTAVLDLASGQILAEEVDAPGVPPGCGFCPVGFYVPDWWDVYDRSTIPGSPFWNSDKEWPTGDFGFVWGCVWGDDSSWKVQYLDLSDVQRGVIRRDKRFGYVELATAGYRSPCLDRDRPYDRATAKPHFISVQRYEGETEVRFAVEMRFDLHSGKSSDWQRLGVQDIE